MLNIMQGFTDNIVGVSASGRVSKKDYDEILIPALKDALAKNAKVRVYYELGPDFSGMDAGAMWEDVTFGMRHLMQWERFVVVTDTAWISQATNAFRFLMPCPVKVFPVSESAAARTWISGKETTMAA